VNKVYSVVSGGVSFWLPSLLMVYLYIRYTFWLPSLVMVYLCISGNLLAASLVMVYLCISGNLLAALPGHGLLVYIR
jgi:hypothetical protein